MFALLQNQKGHVNRGPAGYILLRGYFSLTLSTLDFNDVFRRSEPCVSFVENLYCYRAIKKVETHRVTNPSESFSLLLLSIAQRAETRFERVENMALPFLKEERIVAPDQYLHFFPARKGATGHGLERVRKIIASAIGPDLAIFVDVKPETVVQRLKRRRSVMENLETQKKVREVYRKYVEKDQLVRLDGNKPKSAVAKDLLRTVEEFLEESC